MSDFRRLTETCTCGARITVEPLLWQPVPWWTCGRSTLRVARPGMSETSRRLSARSRSSGASTNRAGELFASGVLRMCRARSRCI